MSMRVLRSVIVSVHVEGVWHYHIIAVVEVVGSLAVSLKGQKIEILGI